MSASTWVPLVTAAAGLLAGLVTGLGGAVLARRWAREDRAAAWQREDELRWHADRLQLYTQVIAALRAWDAELRQVLNAQIRASSGDDGSPHPFDPVEWERHVQAALELIFQLDLIAPDQVTSRARGCHTTFGQFRLRALTTKGADVSELMEAARRTAAARRALTEAMRADLGLGGEQPGPPGQADQDSPS
jgi:hypothetical protein